MKNQAALTSLAAMLFGAQSVLAVAEWGQCKPRDPIFITSGTDSDFPIRSPGGVRRPVEDKFHSNLLTFSLSNSGDQLHGAHDLVRDSRPFCLFFVLTSLNVQ